jgi:predicted Zn-dependent protease
MKSKAFPVRIILLLLTALPLTAQVAPELPSPGSTSVSRQQQEQLGLKTMAEVYKQMPVLPETHPTSRYVQQLGRRLVGVIPEEKSWPYQFHVVQSKDVNAFALPGGPIFINLGTIQAAQNEAQLAGVMAHEISHVYMQHTAKSLPKQEFAQIFAGILGAVLPQSTAGNLARLGINFGAGTVLMKYSRADEAQADSVGAVIMYRAGYDPRALADFFQGLEKQSGGNLQFLSDHPNPGNREQAITRQISEWPPKNFVSDNRNFASAQQDATRARSYSSQEIAQAAKQGQWLRYNQENGSIPRGLPIESLNQGPDEP